MSTELPIDTDDYQHRFGKPAGRAFWSFRIVSADPAIRDHIFTTRKPVIFKEACHEARELARMRRSEKIILVPTGGLVAEEEAKLLKYNAKHPKESDRQE
jgi:hypothetical protein